MVTMTQEMRSTGNKICFMNIHCFHVYLLRYNISPSPTFHHTLNYWLIYLKLKVFFWPKNVVLFWKIASICQVWKFNTVLFGCRYGGYWYVLFVKSISILILLTGNCYLTFTFLFCNENWTYSELLFGITTGVESKKTSCCQLVFLNIFISSPSIMVVPSVASLWQMMIWWRSQILLMSWKALKIIWRQASGKSVRIMWQTQRV